MATTPWSAAKHEFMPNGAGRCSNGWYNDAGKWVPCTSSQASSVLHFNDEADERERHWHDGGDCMCFEGSDYE